MAKRMKKILALVLALVLCVSQVAIPASATEATGAENETFAAGSAQPEENTNDSKNQNIIPAVDPAAEEESQEAENEEAGVSSVTSTTDVVTESGTGTQTVTVTTDAAAGTQTTVTKVETSDEDAGTSTQSTTTEVITVSEDGMKTDMETDWSSTTTETGSEIETGNPTVQTDTNVVTTVTGSEKMNQTITHDETTNTETVESSLKGEETTEIVDTTVTTTTETDVLFSEEVSSETDVSESSGETPETGEWVEGEVQEGQWTEGEVQEGKTTTTTDETSQTTQIEATNPGEATIQMKPNGKPVKVKVDVTIDQVLAGTPIPEGAEEIIEDGKVIGYKIVTVIETTTPDADPTVGQTTEEMEDPVQTPAAPEGYTEGTVTEGNVTTVTEAIRNDNGEIIGYRVTKTTVTEETGVTTTESTLDTTTQTTTGEDVFTLPERPQESQSTDDYGYITETVVEDILENGQVVGYRSTTTYYSPEKEVMRTESSSIYGTTSSSNTLIEKDPETEVETVKTTTTKTEVNEIYTTVNTRDVTLTTERTNDMTTTIVTEEESYQLVETEDGMYFLYKGTMYPVVALKGHGDVELKGLKPTAKPSSKNDLASYTSVTNPPSIVNPGAPGSDQFQYVDYGLISDFRVTKEDGGNTSEVHLYKLVDKAGNAYYAYCADLDTTAYRNTIYDITNAKDEDYYQNNLDKDAHEHLQAIAINGYWGTSSGTGSMEAIKKLLRDNGYTDIANSITDGEAMTATQAAIWSFGNKNSNKTINENNPAKNVSDATSRKNINTLYNLLISEQLKKATPNTETDIITEKDITGATLELKGKVTDSDTGEVVKDSKGNEKYNADLTVILDIEQSALTGNLKVVVKDAKGNVLKEKQLVTEDSNIVGKALVALTDGSGYSCTIEDLEIAEGVKINLNLEGYQNLKKGVYIYTAATGSHKDSQTFIGVSEGKRDVNLQVSLDFTVEDPKLEYVENSTTEIRKDTRVDKKVDTRTDTRKDSLETNNTTTQVVTDTNVKVYGTETTTETKQKVTKEKRDWEAYAQYLLTTVNDEDGRFDEDENENEENDGGVTILDEEVPLAKAPKTGDISYLYAIISGLSLGGIILLNSKRREEA